MSWFMQLHQKYWPMFLSSVQRKDYPEEACLAFQLEVEFVRAFPLLALWGSAARAVLAAGCVCGLQREHCCYLRGCGTGARFACWGMFASSHRKDSWINRYEIRKEKPLGSALNI